jgi:hypothetical protein
LVKQSEFNQAVTVRDYGWENESVRSIRLTTWRNVCAVLQFAPWDCFRMIAGRCSIKAFQRFNSTQRVVAFGFFARKQMLQEFREFLIWYTFGISILDFVTKRKQQIIEVLAGKKGSNLETQITNDYPENYLRI